MYILKDILNGIELESAPAGYGETAVTGVKCDSRQILPGDVFVCFKGHKNDGSEHIDAALKRGARVIVCEIGVSDIDGRALVLRVKDARSVYAKMVSNSKGSPAASLKMIGVTGTNGKTTVSMMIAAGLRAAGKRVALIGTLGASFEGKTTQLASMTTPDPEVLYSLLAEYASLGADYAVMEVSSHALALGKLAGIDFDIAAITNMSTEHMDFHGNMDSYYADKAKLFSICKKGVFLTDDIYTSKMYDEAKCEKVSCSVSNPKGLIRAENIGISFENGTVFTLCREDMRLPLYCPIPATFTVSNALLAASVLLEAGIDRLDIYRGLCSLKNVKGRMEGIYSEEGGFSVYIDFAHTPDALAKLLESVRRLKRAEQRIVTLFGCGGDRDKSKRALMGRVASELSDYVIITSDNSRSESTDDIISQILSGIDKGCPHIRIDDRQKAIEYAVFNAQKGDIILLCGKGHEEYEIDRDGMHPFSEREALANAVEKRRSRFE